MHFIFNHIHQYLSVGLVYWAYCVIWKQMVDESPVMYIWWVLAWPYYVFKLIFKKDEHDIDPH